MSGRVWDRYVGPEDAAIMEKAGYGRPMAWGRRPALLVIDATYDFCGDDASPTLEAIERRPNACGAPAWEAIPRIARLIAVARDRGLPVIYTVSGFRPDGWNLGAWRWKSGRAGEFGTRDATPGDRPPGNAIVAPLEPGPRDIVVEKLKPSAFHGTPLRSLLTLLEVDTLALTGTTTSGCVRATAIDAFSENLRVVVAEDGCFDRIAVSHAISLFDINAKYGDVVAADRVAGYFGEVEPSAFALPPGGPSGG